MQYDIFDKICPPEERVLRIREVVKKTGLPESTIYDFIAIESFPAPIPIGKRAVGWLESEINQWIQERKGLRKQNGWKR